MVLTKLSREFCSRRGKNGGRGGGASHSKDSAAVVASLSSLNLNGGSLHCGSSVGFRLREGIFGRSAAPIVPDHRSMESQSALVPLIFSRS
jgi:hypothetical protein